MNNKSLEYDYREIVLGIFARTGIQYTPEMVLDGIQALKEGLNLYRNVQNNKGIF